MAKSTKAKAPKISPVAQTFYIGGVFVRFTFIRLYRAQTGKPDGEAQAAFESYLSEGRILLDHMSGLCKDVPVYKFK